MGIESISALIAIAVIVIGVGIILYKQPPARNPISYILIVTGVLIISILGFAKSQFNAVDWVQMGLTFGLLAITGMYTWSTQKQANASVKMAEEMRDARYDALRPVVDIVEIEQKPIELARQAYAKGKLPKDLLCKFRNVGVGPAIELYSFIEDITDAKGNPRRCDFGTLPVATGKEEWGYTHEMRLLLMQRGNQMALVAYYKDVYGNPFESIREVSVGAVHPDPLKVRRLPKKEHTE